MIARPLAKAFHWPLWLGLAATPTCAVMAMVTAVGEAGAYQATCFGQAGSGMALMYGLMALFHLPAWLKFIVAGTPKPRR